MSNDNEKNICLHSYIYKWRHFNSIGYREHPWICEKCGDMGVAIFEGFDQPLERRTFSDGKDLPLGYPLYEETVERFYPKFPLKEDKIYD